VRLSELVSRAETAIDVLRGRQTRSAYNGAIFNRLNSDWIVSPLPTDHELITDLRVLRTRCRDLGRNNPIAVRYLSLLEENVIGPFGIGMRSPNRSLVDAWKDFCESPTRDGRYSMVEYCHQLMNAEATDGEIFSRIHIGRQYKYGLALESIDPDLVDENYNIPRDDYQGSNEIRLSVEIDQSARPVGYYCYDEPYFFGMSGRMRYFVPAAEMIHLGRSRRIHQTRFVPWFHPVMDALRMLDGLVEAELVASRAAAAKMGWLVDKTGGSTLGEKNPDGTRKAVPMEATPGSIAVAPPGFEFQGWDPQHPTTQFGEFHNAIVRRIASGLGVSYTSLANDPGDANYASSRTSLQIEQRFWRKIQQFWIRGFMQRVFDEFLKTAPLTGNLDLGYNADLTRVRKVKWEPPGFDWPDPKDDVAASVMAINNHLDSPQRIAAGRGLDFEDDIIQPLKEAMQLAEQAGLPPIVIIGAPPVADTSTSPDNGAGSDPAGGDANASTNGKSNANGNGKPKNRIATA
jgi:lambda family phage portal protein